MSDTENSHHYDENDAREVYNSAIIEDCNSNFKVWRFKINFLLKISKNLHLDRNRYRKIYKQ